MQRRQPPFSIYMTPDHSKMQVEYQYQAEFFIEDVQY